MGVNRSIEALKPALAEALRRALARYGEETFSVLIIETDRLQIVQDAYYAQGRESIEEVNRRRKTAGLY
jgi:hypothetical protein